MWQWLLQLTWILGTAIIGAYWMWSAPHPVIFWIGILLIGMATVRVLRMTLFIICQEYAYKSLARRGDPSMPRDQRGGPSNDALQIWGPGEIHFGPLWVRALNHTEELLKYFDLAWWKDGV